MACLLVIQIDIQAETIEFEQMKRFGGPELIIFLQTAAVRQSQKFALQTWVGHISTPTLLLFRKRVKCVKPKNGFAIVSMYIKTDTV